MVSWLLLAFAGTAYSACTNLVVRREWNELTASEKQTYTDAVYALTRRPIGGDLRDPIRVSYYDFVATHSQFAHWTHGTDQFYLYHRALVFQFEQALATVGWNKGSVYWDWSAVSQNWWTSDVWNYFGEVKSSAPDSCVTQGAFARTRYSVSTDPFSQGQRKVSGDPRCLRRCGRAGSALPDATAITGIIVGPKTYSQFHGDDTSNFHAVGHETLGGANCGDMANPVYSTNDPVFWLHHTFVDKVWWRWQQSCWTFKNDYEGFLNGGDPALGGHNPDRTGVARNQPLDSFSWWKAGDILDTEGDLLCYTYSKSPGDLDVPIVIGCPEPPPPSPQLSLSSSTTSVSPTLFEALPDASPTLSEALLPLPPSVSSAPAPSNRISSSSTSNTSPTTLAAQESITRNTSMTSEIATSPAQLTSTKTVLPSYWSDDQYLLTDLRMFISGYDPAHFASIRTLHNRDYDTPKYTIATQDDGRIMITFPASSRSILIPLGYSVHRIYSTSVQAVCAKTGKPKVFRPAKPGIAYRKPSCAPKDEVIAGGHLEYLAKPERLSLNFALLVGLDWSTVQTNNNQQAMTVDYFNCLIDNEGAFSPSQMKYHV
ncbi:hypothetical protein BC830DRAFT_1121490 [Chytriomyces sp. MP71]|nr:hypothetical protein BC830DRAFT_1121490 [Chytriomyces sp. MP71]